MTEKTIYRVSTISPKGFLLEIVDDNQNPIKGVEFSYVVDNSNSKPGTTDDCGILNVSPVPKNEVLLSLSEQTESPPKSEEGTTEEPEEPEKPGEPEEITYTTESSESNFIIEVVDNNHNPIKGVEFSYVVDRLDSKKGTTDDRGILNVSPEPQNEVRLSLGEQTESPPSKEGNIE